MQLHVRMSVATLRLLWLVQMGKGAFSLQWPQPLGREQRVELVLAVGSESIALAASVRACRPAAGGYHVELILDPLAATTRSAIESALGARPAEPTTRY